MKLLYDGLTSDHSSFDRAAAMACSSFRRLAASTAPSLVAIVAQAGLGHRSKIFRSEHIDLLHTISLLNLTYAPSKHPTDVKR